MMLSIMLTDQDQEVILDALRYRYKMLAGIAITLPTSVLLHVNFAMENIQKVENVIDRAQLAAQEEYDRRI